jgi:TolB protein
MHALSLDEDNAEVHDIRAKLYMARDGNLAGAISQLEVATDLQPDMWLYHYNLGQLLVQAEDYVQGIEALTNALVLRKKPLTYTALGEAYYQSGQYDRAGQYLEQALSAGATDVSTLAQLADIRARLGYCEDARTYFEQALAMEPDQPLALAAKGSCEKSEPAPAPVPTSTSLEEPAPPPPLNGRIAFPVWNVQTGTYDVYVARPDGTQRTLAAEEMRQPAFNPKGHWLAVNGDKADFRNLCILRPDGSGLSEITEHLEDSLPAWSIDGTRLVFSSTRHKDRNSRLYVIDSLPPAGDRVQGRLLNSDLYELLGSGPAWLPDGRIVYSGCDYRQTPASCGLFAISSELGPQIPEQMTTHLTDKAPSVHGNRVAFMSDRDENWEIYVVQGDGSGLMRLTDNAANDALPTWSPDGQTIAFVSDEGGAWAVWAMSPDGSERRRLFDIGGGGLAADWEMERISWGP